MKPYRQGGQLGAPTQASFPMCLSGWGWESVLQTHALRDPLDSHTGILTADIFIKSDARQGSTTHAGEGMQRKGLRAPSCLLPLPPRALPLRKGLM